MSVLDYLGTKIRKLDDRLRRLDFNSNRTVGGSLRRVRVSRHTLTAALLPAILTFLLINGPALRPSWRLGVAGLVIVPALIGFVGALWWSERRNWPFRRDLFIQLAMLGGASAVIWMAAAADAHERGSAVLYRHVLIPVVALTGVSLVIGAWLTALLFSTGRARPETAARLTRIELFAPQPPQASVTWSMFWVAMGAAVVSNALRLLLFPSLGALLLDREWVGVGFGTLLAVNWLLLAFANVDPSFDASWTLLQRLFFRGWSGLVSYAVIALAVARLADVQYVSTVLDGARSWTIGGYIVTAYVLTWWWDYWTSTLITIRLLGLLSGLGTVAGVRIDYTIDATGVGEGLPGQGRVIQSHGAGRLLVLHEDKGEATFNAYEWACLLDALKEGLRSNDPLRTSLDWIKWRLRTHVLLASAVLVGLFGAAILWARGLEQVPHITTTSSAANPLLSVADVVLPADACTSNLPVLAVAASGGGTRAAIYTASILERLQGIGQLKNVRLVSGVSGGSAALAYFVSHRDALLTGGDPAWEAFFKSMTDPYIEDVIDGAGEWRMVTGDRFGRLLAESFDRSWGTTHTTLRDIQNVGLILNSALAGRVPRMTDDPQGQSLAAIERAHSDRGRSDVAGGRLIFTNLDIPDHFRGVELLDDGGQRDETRDTRLPVFVINGSGVPLAAAAAASANFPPVFPNVAVDRAAAVRFWATDGGAIDNRGTETLLLAVRYALEHQQDRPCPALPALHVIEVEASAFSDAYQQDRGVGSMMSAGAAFASQLGAEVLADIRALYKQKNAANVVRFHFLPMPALLRRAGSFGTHWMMQPRVTVCRDAACHESMTMTADDVLSVLRKPGAGAPLSDAAERARDFIARDEPSQGRLWERVAQCLATPQKPC